MTQAIVPWALGSLITGLLMSVGTKWGLLRHYWVLTSLVLTIIATVVLLAETQTISRFADVAADPTTPGVRNAALSDAVAPSR